jgi:site-specific DNA-methyltransferase (adenine-specific)
MPSLLLHGDNLPLLREKLSDGSVDLVYADPPFKSGARYHLARRPAAGRSAFDDVWSWDDRAEAAMEEGLERCPAPVVAALEGFRLMLGPSSMLAYLAMMAPRLAELRRVLRSTGSIYLHCDPSASHYIKVLMDAVFGSRSFLNNIVWLYGLGGSSRRRWPRKHDDILWYAREPGQQYFDPPMVPARSQRMKGQLKKAPDYWEIPAINNQARERTGYPTQKPVALLDRIVRSSSRPGDLVLDPWCGSGTTLVVAEALGRQWIGIDSSADAIDLARERCGMSATERVERSSD